MIDFLKKHHVFPLAEKVCKTIQKNGGIAHLAGGCVRDAILKRVPNDLDIATSLNPDQVEKLFPKTLDVGKKFGTITVVEGSESVEVTTFRKDLEYENGRHPVGVEFSSEKEDAFRRDFTVNALFLDLEKNKVVDYVDGLKDLSDKCLRAVGDPEKRFQEDHLRILRAIRFQAQLDFSIEKQTEMAIQKMPEKILSVSGERIYQELLKLVQGIAFARAFASLVQTGLFSALWKAQLSHDLQKQLKIAESIPQPMARFFWLSLSMMKADQYAPAVLHFEKTVRLSKDDMKILKLVQSYLQGDSQKISAEDLLPKLFDPLEKWLFTQSTDNRKDFLKIIESYPAKPEALVKASDLPANIKGEKIGLNLKKAYLAQLKNSWTDKQFVLKWLQENIIL